MGFGLTAPWKEVEKTQQGKQSSFQTHFVRDEERALQNCRVQPFTVQMKKQRPSKGDG